MKLEAVGLFSVGCRQKKRCAHKPETIDTLKDNIRVAIGEIQLHTISFQYISG